MRDRPGLAIVLLRTVERAGIAIQAGIEGLRALAVIPVVLFHAGVPGFGGGCVGVDAFFVISGYLISGVILSDLQQGRFSLADFYERRARRILPALIPVLLTSALAAWAVMIPARAAGQ